MIFLTHLISKDDLPYLAISISVLAFVVAVTNVGIGIWNFILSRTKLITVSNIHVVHEGDEIVFNVDVLSRGAPIWDLAVEMVITYPLTKDFVKADAFGKDRFRLTPVAPVNALSAGQSMRYSRRWVRTQLYDGEMKRAIMRLQRTGNLRKRKHVSLCVYCNGNTDDLGILEDGTAVYGSRKLLKRIKNLKFHHNAWSFFESAISGSMGMSFAKPSFIQVWLSRRYMRKFIKRDNFIKQIREEMERAENKSEQLPQPQSEPNQLEEAKISG